MKGHQTKKIHNITEIRAANDGGGGGAVGPEGPKALGMVSPLFSLILEQLEIQLLLLDPLEELLQSYK